jgi:trigger factor
MQVSIESGEGLERRMTVELPAERVDEEIDKRLKHIAKTAKMAGFRPGKVPMSMVRKRYSDQVRQEVFGELVQSTYFEALSHEKLQPAGNPTIEPLEKQPGEGMAYTAVFEVLPEIELSDLSGVSIKRPKVEVTDDDLQEMIERLRKQRVTWSDVERAAEKGDRATINFKGYIDGEPFQGGSADEAPLVLGSGAMIEGFEEGLMGAAAGDNRTLEVKFPEDYRVNDLAGKPATFEVEVTKVSEPVLPEVDDEFAKAFGVTEGGMDAFKAEIRSNMEREAEEKVRNILKQQAMDALLEQNAIDIPQAMVQQEAQALLEQTKANMAQSGQSSNLELPPELFEEQAKRRVSLGLLIAEVVKANDIQLDEARLRARVEEVAASYEQPQEVIDYYYSNQQQLAGMQNLVLEEQVMDWVLEQAQVEDEDTAFADLMNPSEEQS